MIKCVSLFLFSIHLKAFLFLPDRVNKIMSDRYFPNTFADYRGETYLEAPNQVGFS